MRRTYVISDFHFNHTGILRIERGEFKTIEEHNQYIVDKYNSVVGEHDVCYILGDIGFNNPKLIKKWVQKLHGYKILIKGNHDRFSTAQAIEMGFKEVYDHPVYFNSKIILSHEPVREALDNPYVINVHGHVHQNDVMLPNFYNVNVASVDYLPVNMDVYIRKSFNCKDRRETWGKEWYYNFYKTRY